MVTKEAVEALRAFTKELQQRFPTLGITMGYLGNVERWGDDRAWYFFTQVETIGTWGPERLKRSFNPSDSIEAVKADVEGWIVRRVAPAEVR